MSLTPRELPPTESLLQPITEAAPAGVSLRYSAAYDAIVEARSAEADLPRGAWQRTEKRSDWSLVERLCIDALTTKSKDLQIAVWLCEAWLHLSALDGLIASARFLSGLHETFHLTMYPVDQPGEPLPGDIVEHRTNLMRAFNQKAALEVRFVALSAPPDTSMLRYSLAELDQAKFNDQVLRHENSSTKPNENAYRAFDEADAATPAIFIAELSKKVTTAIAEIQRLDAVLDETYGKENTGLNATKEELGKIAQHLTPRLLSNPMPLPPDNQDDNALPVTVENFSESPTIQDGFEYDGGANPPIESTSPQEDSLTGQPMGQGARRGPANRREAYEQIRLAAEFLSRTEPHSPVPYLLRRALRWGSLSLQELLPELLQHPEQLSDQTTLHDSDPYD